MNEAKYPVKRGKEYELTIERLAFGGAGVARMDNYVIFVKGALPGDVVIARIGKRKKSFAEAKLITLLSASEHRIEAPCPYFEWCGGCTWQNMSYSDQLSYKQKIVAESFSHLAGLSDIAVEPVMASDSAFAYRNKMEFSFADRRWLLPHELGQPDISMDFALGLHVPGTFDKILQIDHCLLQSETANEILRMVSGYARQNKLVPYGIRSHEGFLRFLVIRESACSGDLMVNIVTASEQPDLLKPLALELMQKFEPVRSVVNNINSRPAQIAQGEKEIVLAGQPFIQERLGKFDFNISANSFFQTNSRQAEKLYDLVIRFAELKKDQVVWDLYAGTGTITLFLAQQAREVIGFEIVESAVNDALQNSRSHGIINTRFVGGDLLQHLRLTEPRPDVIVTDPPRAGMHEKVTRYLNELAARRIVYVSCNPTTLARDLAILSERYTVGRVQPVDMFPQTYHIETVVQLNLK